MRCIVIDTETTGSEEDAKVVEIGGIAFVWDGEDMILGPDKYLQRLHTFVDPDMPIPAQAKAIHHITDEDVTGAQKIEEAAKPFHGFDLYIAHHAAFDRRMLPMLGGQWVCTMKAAYEQWHDAPSYANQVLRYWLGTPSPPASAGHAHRALYDAYTTLGILDRLTAAGWTAEQLIEVSSRPRRLRTIDFGKHRGERFDRLPRSYLDWMRRTGGWDEDVTYTLEQLT